MPSKGTPVSVTIWWWIFTSNDTFLERRRFQRSSSQCRTWVDPCLPSCFTELLYRVALPSCFTELLYRVVLPSCFTQLFYPVVYWVVLPSCFTELFYPVVLPSCFTQFWSFEMKKSNQSEQSIHGDQTLHEKWPTIFYRVLFGANIIIQ